MKRPPWLRRGQWRPEQVSASVLVIKAAALTACLTRGLDYLRRDSDATSVLSRVQDTAPLPMWGAVFLAAVAIVVVGVAGRWATIVGFGHIVAMLVYAGVAYGLFQVTGFGPGVRTPMGLIGAAAIHGALGMGTFAVQRRVEELEHPSDAA